MQPIVSIIIPTFNREKLIRETLDSVLAQSFQHWECIIIDDGSIDGTEDIVNCYVLKDNRFKFFPRPANRKKGASTCRNYGLDRSVGDLIQFLDSDDLLAYNKLEEQIKDYRQGDLSLYTCKWGGFEESNNLSKRFKYKYNSYRNFNKGHDLLRFFGKFNEYFPLHVYLTPRKLIDSAGPWNEDLTNNDDGEFFCRVILNASKITFSPKASVYYRYNSGEKLSDLDSEEKVISAIKSWKLISNHIHEKGSRSAITYVANYTGILYPIVKISFPHLLKDEIECFEYKEQMSKPKNVLSKVKYYLKSIFDEGK